MLMIARLHKGKGVIFMSKKKIFKILGIILLVVIAIFLIHTIRNYIIITDNIVNFINVESLYSSHNVPGGLNLFIKAF